MLDWLNGALKQEGFDGFFNADLECGCEIGDLSPGDCLNFDCEPGVKRFCTKDCTHEGASGKNDTGEWHIEQRKEE